MGSRTLGAELGRWLEQLEQPGPSELLELPPERPQGLGLELPQAPPERSGQLARPGTGS